MGHSWVGLLLLRAMDPGLLTPVPLAYAYKMMMFFVPASGGKNAIVIGEGYGEDPAGFNSNDCSIHVVMTCPGGVGLSPVLIVGRWYRDGGTVTYLFP